jgi:hypothetical protein
MRDAGCESDASTGVSRREERGTHSKKNPSPTQNSSRVTKKWEWVLPKVPCLSAIYEVPFPFL